MPASAARRNMILGQLMTSEVLDSRILQAMEEIPRETFVPPLLAGAAYVDEDIDVGGGRMLMAPVTLARLLALLELTPACKLLVVGALSGYAAAVAAKLAGYVTAIDTDATLIDQARKHMHRLHLANAHPHQVPSLAAGYGGDAPYDAILIHGAIRYLPEVLAAQMGPKGRCAAVRNVASRPGGAGGLGKGVLIVRIDGKLQLREHFDATATVLPGFERKETFVF